MLRLLLCLFAGAICSAATEIPSILGPHMVLQRDRAVPIWGWDDAGTTVRVSFRGTEVTATAGSDRRWEVALPTGAAGGPFPLAITGSSRLELADVLVGEVWIAGGQSNMWWQLRNCTDGKEAIAAADLPQLRWYDANNGPKEAGWPADTPSRSVATAWQVSSPAVADDFAGTAFFFARALQQRLRIPVGIVHLAVPGTSIEVWLRDEVMQGEFADVLELHALRKAAPEVHERLHADARTAWEAKARKGGEPHKLDRALACSSLWNGMVAPCVPFAARGFVWWQGESNAWNFGSYRSMFPALVADWRQQFRLGDAPFIFAELAGFGTRANRPVEDAPWPAARDAQRRALHLPGTAMICTLDILADHVWEIHPPDKALAGSRLLRAAMALAHQGTEEWSGPQPESFRFADGAAGIAFTHASGLRARAGAPLEGFAIAGADRVWHAGTATIVDGQVTVRSADVPMPVAVRYAWRNNPRECNLENAAGLPASQFRSDAWPLCGGGR